MKVTIPLNELIDLLQEARTAIYVAGLRLNEPETDPKETASRITAKIKQYIGEATI